MSKLTLFELTHEIRTLVDEMVEAIESEDPEYLAELESQLAQFHHAREDKLQSYVHVIKNAENTAEGIRKQVNAFLVRARALENLANRLKDTLLNDMTRHREQAAAAGTFKISRHQSPPTVDVRIPPEDLPSEYQRITVDADKVALKSALNRGEAIDGVELTEGEHIRIRVK